jgi:phage N-6-adenine-methyltransferase
MRGSPADPGKLANDLLLATKAILDRDLDLGLITPNRLRFTIEARKEAAKEMAAKGMTTREIAEVVGCGKSTIARDLDAFVPFGTSHDEETAEIRDASVANATNKKPSTRALLAQSDQNDWRTPRKFLEAAHAVMGGIDLDPASSAEANQTVEATTFYTEADDGLTQPWNGRVWLNPPYGGKARLFIGRLIQEYNDGNVTAACALVNSHPTETQWFQALFDYPICFIRGRIDFGGPSRAVSTSSTHGSAVCFLGKDTETFARVFSKFGAVVRRMTA